MRTTLLLLLATGCTQGIEDSQTPAETGETLVTGETEVTDLWEATFWRLEGGAWVEDRARVDAYVGGYSLAYGGDIGAGTQILRWSGASWDPVDDVDRETTGPIDAYTGNGSDHYVAVGAQLYSWANPGQWGRWLDPAPGNVSAISYVGSRTVAVGSQLYTYSTYDDTWYTSLSAAPDNIQCIIGVGGDEPQTYIIAGTTSYRWGEDDSGWVATGTPEAPFPLVGGCAMDGEGNVVLVTNKLLE